MGTPSGQGGQPGGGQQPSGQQQDGQPPRAPDQQPPGGPAPAQGFGPPQGFPPPAPHQAQGYPPGGAPAYGYPPPAAPGGYGYPPPAAPGGYGYPPVGPVEPDWYAMAEENEQAGRRRRRIRIGIGVGCVLALAGVVTAALVLYKPGDKKPSSDEATASAPQTVAGCVSPTVGPQKSSSDLRLGPATQVGTVAGHSGLALTLRGNGDSYAEVGSVVVDTCKSFTVSAVVRNASPGEPRAALSQGSDGFFSFYLGRGAKNQWVFKIQGTAESGSAVEALSSASDSASDWTTLTGVYNAAEKSISLYVNGELAKTTPAPNGILSTNGPIEIGRARFKSRWVDAWIGSLADLQVWEQPLTAAQISQIALNRSADVDAKATWFRF
ncbi:hypothetical protein Kpho02_36120 [Kitasatospora phosalacinea]|uniref:LamG-like jellyroll fold domain-containing protein n=2 Tax=Kitasatospora phosalacinea TaxID=2065 RepID=A0A9W6V2J5_9ACTN|nr:hypothetical protein Kpho02_36120 [Kitasatospora phosalacinea]